MNNLKKQQKMSFGKRWSLGWEIIFYGVPGGKAITPIDKINEASKIRLASYDSSLKKVVVVLSQAMQNAENIESSCRTDFNLLEGQISEAQKQVAALNESKNGVDKRLVKAADVKQKISDFIRQLESDANSSSISKT